MNNELKKMVIGETCNLVFAKKMTPKEKDVKYGKIAKKFPSSSSNKIYEVRKKGGKCSCNCPGWTFRKTCKHTKAVCGE